MMEKIKDSEITPEKVAEFFLMINKLEDVDCRFDVIEILTDTTHSASVNHIKNAFDYNFIYS